MSLFQTAEPEFKAQCSSGMLTAADRYAPGKFDFIYFKVGIPIPKTLE